jgi:hypothetical protein
LIITLEFIFFYKGGNITVGLEAVNLLAFSLFVV